MHGIGNGSTRVWDLNYPSLALSTSPSEAINRTFTRTVTNVGLPTSTYTAVVKVRATTGLEIKVTLGVLSFTSVRQKLLFSVTVQGKMNNDTVVSASLTWDDGAHRATSPIVAHAVSS